METELARGVPVKLPGLAHSAEMYEKASQLGRHVETHFRDVKTLVATHAPAQQSAPASPEMERARALLRNRESIRSAIVAAVILGPSKASEG